LKFAEIVLAIGNFMNGTAGSALGFKIETLNKLIDTKTIENDSTLLHYIVQIAEKKDADAINIHKDFPSLEAASKVSFSGMSSDASELKAQHTKLSEIVNNVKAASKNDPFQQQMPAALAELKDKVEKLNLDIETFATEFKALEESFRGESDGSTQPEEMFQQFNKFIENLKRVREDLEMSRVKKERAEQKEKKIQNALLTEIQKGIKLKKTPKKEEPKQVKGSILRKGAALQIPMASPGQMGGQQKSQQKSQLSQQNAQMGNIAAQIALRNKLKKPATPRGATTSANPSTKLDALIMEYTE
jgi:hypothetical protein